MYFLNLEKIYPDGGKKKKPMQHNCLLLSIFFSILTDISKSQISIFKLVVFCSWISF